MDFISAFDYVLLPFYFGIIIFVARNIRNKIYPPGHPYRPFFMPALTIKLVGAVIIGLIYQYYYGKGDTSLYFLQSKVVSSAMAEGPLKYLTLALHLAPAYDGDFIDYTSRLPWYDSASGFTVIGICSFVNFLTFGTYLNTSLIFACLSFTGLWAMFRTFAGQTPQLSKRVALAVLFIPSVAMWGSGIFKDTLCMFGLGWMTYAVFRLLINRDFSPFTIGLAVLSFYLIAKIKVYILIAFLPALTLWIVFQYANRIKSGFVRTFYRLGFVGLVTAGFTFLASRYSKELGGYSLENIEQTVSITRNYIYRISGEEGSTYDIGAVNITSLGGMLTTLPKAVNVSLFRPYPWEARKIIVFANSIEATLLLLLTFKVIFTLGLGKVWEAIRKDATIQFCLIFTIIFAFAVGISSGNFGALSRYRIPCLPFYSLALILIYYRYNSPDKKLVSFGS